MNKENEEKLGLFSELKLIIRWFFYKLRQLIPSRKETGKILFLLFAGFWAVLVNIFFYYFLQDILGWPHFVLWVGWLFFLISAIDTTMLASDHNYFLSRLIKTMETGDKTYGIVDIFATPLILFISFTVICREIWAHYPNAFISNGYPLNNSIWILFGLDNLLGASLFDFFEIYELVFTQVEFGYGWGAFMAQTAVFIFRVSIGAGLLGFLFKAYRNFISEGNEAITL